MIYDLTYKIRKKDDGFNVTIKYKQNNIPYRDVYPTNVFPHIIYTQAQTDDLVYESEPFTFTTGVDGCTKSITYTSTITLQQYLDIQVTHTIEFYVQGYSKQYIKETLIPNIISRFED